MSYFAIDSCSNSALNSINFAEIRFGAVSSVGQKGGNEDLSHAQRKCERQTMTTNKQEDHQRRESTPTSRTPAHRGQPELEQQEQVNDRAQALAVKLAQTYEELSRLLERNPGMKRQMTEGDAKKDKIYQRLKFTITFVG